jgi:hypothetical protein
MMKMMKFTRRNIVPTLLTGAACSSLCCLKLSMNVERTRVALHNLQPRLSRPSSSLPPPANVHVRCEKIFVLRSQVPKRLNTPR